MALLEDHSRDHGKRLAKVEDKVATIGLRLAQWGGGLLVAGLVAKQMGWLPGHS